jgi:hypothetical protein
MNTRKNIKTEYNSQEIERSMALFGGRRLFTCVYQHMGEEEAVSKESTMVRGEAAEISHGGEK